MDFWSNIFSEISGNTVLELACGTGRLAFNLVREGADYTGLEISPDFADLAKKKLTKAGSAVSIISGDMRSFQLNQTFDLIFIGFNSFLHLLRDKDAISCFECVKKHMHENTRFIIDIFTPNPLFLYRPEDSRFPVLEYTNSKTDEHVCVEESNIYDRDTEINELTWYFSTKKKKDFAVEHFSMRMYFPSKMNQILIDFGFKIFHQWGDYYRTDLNEGSKLQIYDVQLGN